MDIPLFAEVVFAHVEPGEELHSHRFPLRHRKASAVGIIIDGFLEPFKTFIKLSLAVDGGKRDSQEILLARLADCKSAGMHDGDASLAEIVFSFRT